MCDIIAVFWFLNNRILKEKYSKSFIYYSFAFVLKTAKLSLFGFGLNKNSE